MRESFILTMLYKLNGPSLPLTCMHYKNGNSDKQRNISNYSIVFYLFFLALHNKFAKVSLNSFNNSLCLINTLLTRFNESKP